MRDFVDPFDSNTWNEEERRYFEHVDRALRFRINRVISNGRVEHAAYIIHKLLISAQRKVRIFSGRLSRTYNGFNVYSNDQIIKAIEKFLSLPGSELTVILEHELDIESHETIKDHPVVHVVDEAKQTGRLRGKFEIRQASEEATHFLREKDYSNHWMLMDNEAYRLETNTEQAGAHVNFADAKTAGALAIIFDKLLYQKGRELIRISN